MTSIDVLNISLSIAVIGIAISFAYAAYNFVQALKPTKEVIQRLDDATRGIKLVEDTFKIGVASILGEILKKLKESHRPQKASGSKGGEL